MKRTLLARNVAALSIATSSIYALPSFASNDVETITVTASGFEQQLSDVIAPIEIITKEEIDATQAQSLTELLRKLPGVQIANSGGPGQQSDLYVRGRSTKNTLILINGVRIGSATTGTANLTAIPLQGIQRVEFLRGPRAAIYGSDAVSGVVNLITTGATEQKNTVKVGYGSNNLIDVVGSFNLLNTDTTWLNVSGSYTDSEGYNIQPDSTNPFDSDDDGYSTEYVLLDFGHKISDKLTIKSNGYYQNHDSEYDNPWGGTDNSSSVLYNLSAIGEYRSDKFNSTFTLATNQDQAESFGQGVDKSEITTSRNAANWNNQYNLSPSLNISGGLDWYKDDVVNTTVAMTETDRSNTAVYAGSYYGNEYANLEANVRFDDNTAYGSYTTYQLGGSFNTTDASRIVVQHGTSFKAPTFNDLYWPLQCSFWGCYSGNSNLVPEETGTTELAFEADFDLASVRAAAHYSQISNLITSTGSTQENIKESEIKGVELITLFSTGPLFHTISYDYLDAKDAETELALARVAEHSAKWNLSYAVTNWLFDLAYVYQGERFNDSANTVTLDAYSLVDLTGSYEFSNGVKASAKVGNLLDEEYETVQGFKTPERNYYASIEYKF